jgi:hypothetical protein
MAAIGEVEEEDTELLEAADWLLSTRLALLFMFAGEVVSSRYRQCKRVGRFDMAGVNSIE